MLRGQVKHCVVTYKQDRAECVCVYKFILVDRFGHALGKLEGFHKCLASHLANECESVFIEPSTYLNPSA